MSNELTKGGDSRELSTDINVITAEINAYQRVAGEAVFEIGRRLKHVKENDLAHGEWTKWCEGVVGIDRSTANKFIRVFDELEDVGTYPRLGLRALYEIATLPPEERDVPHELPTGETKKPEDMTVRELREVKRQLRKEKERVERLEKEKDAERSERERLEDELEKTTKIEVRTEYVEVENVPQDYEEIKQENAKLRRKFGDGKTRVIDDEARREFYRDFANDLDYIVGKYGSIVFDGDKIKEFGSSDVEYASKVNDFDEFWKRYVRAVTEDQTIINAEGF